MKPAKQNPTYLFTISRERIWRTSWRKPPTGCSLLRRLTAGRCTFTPTSLPGPASSVETGKMLCALESAEPLVRRVTQILNHVFQLQESRSRGRNRWRRSPRLPLLIHPTNHWFAVQRLYPRQLPQPGGAFTRHLRYIRFKLKATSSLTTAHLSTRGMLQIYEIPFFVALDHKREAILVAVRGTLSLKVSWDLFFPPFSLAKNSMGYQLSKYGLFVVCLVFFFLPFPTDSPLILILKVDAYQLDMRFPVLCLLAGRL